MQTFDFIVIGGGMIGAATALGLAQQGRKVALLEKQPLPTFDANQPYDIRISAISEASIRFLQQLGVWDAIAQQRSFDYTGLECGEMEGFATRFSAEQLNLPRLGAMVENTLLQLSLWQALSAYPNCTQAVNFREIFAKREENLWQVKLDDNTFSAPVLIAADGANSKARLWANIGNTGWHYRQHCLLATVKTEKPAPATTWQQFYPSGPRALLPLANQSACLVWYDAPEKIAQLTKLPLSQLKTELLQHFPARLSQELGEIHVEKVAHFPLTRQHAHTYVKNGVVLVGDAAHSINPLAGQGVNLGFKDVQALLEAVKNHENFADEAVLKPYEQQRKKDNLLMQTAMDLFYKGFKHDWLPLKLARNAAFLLADKITPLKRQALKYAIGLAD